MDELIKRLTAWRDSLEPLDHEGFYYGLVERETLTKVIEMLSEEHELIDEGLDFIKGAGTGEGESPVLTHRWRCPVCGKVGVSAKPEQLAGYRYCHMCGAKLREHVERVKEGGRKDNAAEAGCGI